MRSRLFTRLLTLACVLHVPTLILSSLLILLRPCRGGGRRSDSGRLLEFRPGGGLLLLRRGVRVAPVWIQGAEKRLPVGAGWPRPGRITVTFGPAMDPRELEREGEGAEPRERVMRALRQRVAALGDSVEANKFQSPQGDAAG